MIYITANPSFERDAAKARRAINSDVSGINMINYDDEKSILNFELFDDVARKIITVPFVCASVDEEKRCSNDVYISLATGAAKSLILN